VNTIESGIVVEGTTSQWHSGSSVLGMLLNGIACWLISNCLLTKWLRLKLGEDPLGLVLPPGEVLCGDFAPTFSGRVGFMRVEMHVRCA